MVGNKANNNGKTAKRERKLLPQIKHKFSWEKGFVIPNIRPVCYREVTSKRRCQLGPQKSVSCNVSTT